jgi:cysteine-rich repeat protein
MRKLRLTIVLGLVVGSQAGCTVTHEPDPVCGDGFLDVGEQCDDGNTIADDGCTACTIDQIPVTYRTTANWMLKNVSGTTTACPGGYDTAAVYSQAVNASDVPVGQPIIDLFTCSDMTGTTSDLPAGRYQTWIDITNTNNTLKYASSLSAIVDLTASNKTFSAQILNDGGYFQLAWNLIGAVSSNALTCAQAGAAGGVEAVSTDVGNASNFVSDVFTCTDQVGVSAGLLAATYSVDVQALDGSMAAISNTPTLLNKTILVHNAVTDLGTVTIPITGL